MYSFGNSDNNPKRLLDSDLAFSISLPFISVIFPELKGGKTIFVKPYKTEKGMQNFGRALQM